MAGELIFVSKDPVLLGDAAGGLSKTNNKPWGKIEIHLMGGAFVAQCTPEQAQTLKPMIGQPVKLAVRAAKERFGQGVEFHLVDCKPVAAGAA